MNPDRNRRIKRFFTLGILCLILVGVFVPTNNAFAETAIEKAQRDCIAGSGTWTIIGSTNGEPNYGCAGGNKDQAGKKADDWSLAEAIFGGLARGVGYAIMTLSAGILSLVGILFDAVIKFTIINIAENIGDPNGVGGSINKAWGTLRDIANMAFIFVLLFAAFKAMFDLNYSSIGKTVKNIIIVALLINFSLFFTKVVIDASNIVAVGFYKSITTANTASVGGTNATISSGYMRLLGLQSWYSPNVLAAKDSMEPQQVLIVGIMSSIFFLVTAVILLITAVMFLARFIILIFIMILSPLALIAYIIPGMKGQFDKWKNALIDQSFFAPLFFALTWVVFKIASTPGFLGQLGAGASGANTTFVDSVLSSPTSSLALILNFVIVLGFAIAALVFSKQMAAKTAGFTAIAGGIGTGAIGGAAIVGRNTIGRASKLISETQRDRLSKSAIGRGVLWTANKGAKGSFDARAIDTIKKVPGLGDQMGILGKAGGKGGIRASDEEKAKKRAQYIKDVYGQSDTEKARMLENQREAERTRERLSKDPEEQARIAVERERKAEEAKIAMERDVVALKTHVDTALEPQNTELKNLETERNKHKAELDKIKSEGRESSREYKIKEGQYNEAAQKAKEKQEVVNSARKAIEETDEYKALKEKAEAARKTHAEAEKKKTQKTFDDNELSEADKIKKLSDEAERLKTVGRERQQTYADRTEQSKIGKAIKTGLAGTGGAISGATIGGAVGAIGGPVGMAVGAVVGGAVGAVSKALGSLQFREDVVRRAREQAKGETKDQMIARLAKERAKELEEEEKKSGAGTTPPPPPPTGTASSTTT